MQSTDDLTGMNGTNDSSHVADRAAVRLLQTSVISRADADTDDVSGSIAAMVVLAVLAAVTNSLLLSIMLLRRPLRANPSNRLVMSLTVLNLLLSLLVLPMCMVVTYSHTVTWNEFPFNEAQRNLPHSHTKNNDVRTTKSAVSNSDHDINEGTTEDLVSPSHTDLGQFLTTASDIASSSFGPSPSSTYNLDYHFTDLFSDSVPSVLPSGSSKDDDISRRDSRAAASSSETNNIGRTRRSAERSSVVLEGAGLLKRLNSALDGHVGSGAKSLASDKGGIIERILSYYKILGSAMSADGSNDRNCRRRWTQCQRLWKNNTSKTLNINYLYLRQCLIKLNFELGEVIGGRCNLTSNHSGIKFKSQELCSDRNYHELFRKWTQFLGKLFSRDSLSSPLSINSAKTSLYNTGPKFYSENRQSYTTEMSPNALVRNNMAANQIGPTYISSKNANNLSQRNGQSHNFESDLENLKVNSKNQQDHALKFNMAVISLREVVNSSSKTRVVRATPGAGEDRTRGGTQEAEEPVSEMVEELVSGMVDDPVSGMVEDPVSGMVEEPVSGMVEEPVSGTVEEPVSGTVEEPVSGMVETVPSTLCLLVGFLTNWLFSTSSFTVAVIALDRFVSQNYAL
ncbi:uncharacterized protein LOC108670784 [Hyalella azteca]|uniref:Uncharacterized protein LOC108670784 n=1 Tax=Hyalella azteca TaxID=294128 RepID=A0A8B7NKE9_HYAAZ|nr:uncharacterized protein LOC108670784 [Hyalella azteca]